LNDFRDDIVKLPPRSSHRGLDGARGEGKSVSKVELFSSLDSLLEFTDAMLNFEALLFFSFSSTRLKKFLL
jgi:hypothetical protein